jgi:hypothetical protein
MLSAAEYKHRQSRSDSGLSLLHELRVQAAVPDGFVEIAAGLAMQRGQPTMSSN